jgi:nitronate monooxygenase
LVGIAISTRIERHRAFGVNLFVPSPVQNMDERVARYADALSGEAERYGVELGDPRHDDDGWRDKLSLLAEERVAVVSLTLAAPRPK